jgi:Caspase domain/Putative peptidoglycan binding domain
MSLRFSPKLSWLVVALAAAALCLAHWESAAAQDRVRMRGFGTGLGLGLIIGGLASQDRGNAGGRNYRSCSSLFGPGAVNAAANPSRCVCRTGYAWASEGGNRRCIQRGTTNTAQAKVKTRSVNTATGGGRNNAVELEKIQEAMNLLGYDAGEVDGELGQKTQRAIFKYQADKHFPQSGHLSPAEQQALFADVEAKRVADARFQQPKLPDPPAAQNNEQDRGLPKSDVRMELTHWETVRNSKIAGELEDYIARYPSGEFTKLASLRLDQIRAQTAKEEEDARVKRFEPAKNASGTAGLPPVDDATFPRAKQRRPDGVAVIIGNGAYRHGVPSVEYSARDAEAMKLVAAKTLGIDAANIIFLKDATRGAMDEVFGTERDHKGKLWRMIDPDGRSDVYVFYSGHGVPGVNDTDGNFLLPVDGDPNHASLNGYPLKQLYKNLAELKTKSITVFLDACFSGQSADKNGTPLIQNASPVFISKGTPRDVGKINVFAAASERQLSSWDPEAGHGIFTRYVLAGLAGEADEDRNREITAKELRDYVSRQVRKAARRMHGREQEPWFEGDDGFVVSSF